MLGINIDDAGSGGEGVKVVSASPGGPAADAGVRSGDIVTAMDGKPLGSGRDLVSWMRSVEPGQYYLELGSNSEQLERVALSVQSP